MARSSCSGMWQILDLTKAVHDYAAAPANGAAQKT